MDLYQHTAKELRQKLLGKECSAAEIAQSVFSRIDACEERVGAYVTLDRENALAAAKAVDKKIAAGEEIGPLAGIPVAVKDNICTRDALTILVDFAEGAIARVGVILEVHDGFSGN